MNVYLEGSDQGKVRIKDVEKSGECMFILPTDFTEAISSVCYNKEKNVLFIAAKDGKFRIWKVPKEWRSKKIEDVEKEFEYTRK